ncbi:hypothetical protein ABMA27_001610 [Loxostege sticticalis]|uniref:Chromo domain-containing protein n=1 Tax=Loxostege sticticalis TaxID=481309 RepID=A0ABR3HZ30_LOXSC
MPRKKNGFDLADLEGSSDDNTWEPEENLDPGANAFGDAQPKKEKEAGATEALDESLASRKRGRSRKKRVEEIEKPRGLDRGLQPEKILAAQLFNSSLFFLVKWQGCTDLDVVPGKDLNQQYPEFVIEYYESCVPFSVRHKIGKTPRIAPELPPEPEPVQETPMDVSENVQDQTEFSQDQTAESALLNTEEPAPPAEPQELPQEQIQQEPQPMEVPVN